MLSMISHKTKLFHLITLVHNSIKFHENHLKIFCTILLMDRWTDKQTDGHWQEHYLLGRGYKDHTIGKLTSCLLLKQTQKTARWSQY